MLLILFSVILGLDPGIHLQKIELDSRLRGNDEGKF